MLIDQGHFEFKYFKVTDQNDNLVNHVCYLDTDKKFCIVYADVDTDGTLRTMATKRLYDVKITDTRN